MRPTEAVLEGIGVEPAAAGAPTTWKMSRGEVLQITQTRPTLRKPDLLEQADRRLRRLALRLPPERVGRVRRHSAADPPFAQWGTEYALVPFKPRTVSVTSVARENVPWSIVGAVDGTVLTYDPEQPPGAPDTLAAGEVANFITDARVSVKSQDSKHPFYAAVHMTGATYGGGAPTATPRSATPTSSTSSHRISSSIVTSSSPTTPSRTPRLLVVRRKTPTGFHPVVLDCAGELTGFVPLGTKGEYEYAFVDLTKGAVPQKFEKGACGYGRHEGQSEGPFFDHGVGPRSVGRATATPAEWAVAPSTTRRCPS